MIIAFFESIKYVGHLLPVAILRIYFGYLYFTVAMERYSGDFLTRPRLAALLNEWMPQSHAPIWYQDILENWVIPNWQLSSYLLTYSEFFIGLSLIFGFLVRPAALIGIFWSMAFLYSSAGSMATLYELHLVFFLTLGWLGAGRCLGFDYFFFKRQRGLWW